MLLLDFKTLPLQPQSDAATKGRSMRASPKPYLYVEELAELVPWSIEAIRKRVQRGELRLGTHYFQERQRARLIFKWEMIVALIEQGSAITSGTTQPRAGSVRGNVLDVVRVAEELRRLLAGAPSAEGDLNHPSRSQTRRKSRPK